MTIASIELDQDRMHLSGPSRMALMFTGFIATMRRRHAARRRMQTLRGLSDHILVDIGVDPATVRDDMFLAPEQTPLIVFPQGGR